MPVTSNGTLLLPLTAPNFTGTLTLNGATSTVTSGVTVELTIQNTLPAGFPTLQSIARSRSARSTLSTVPSPAPLLYIEPIFSATVSGTGGSIALTVPATDLVAGDTYYVAFYDPNASTAGWQTDFAGPASVSGNILTFTLNGGVTFAARTTYAFTVYGISSSAEQPTPASTATPTASPSPAPTATGTAPASPTPSPTTTANSTPSPAPPGVLSVDPDTISIPAPGVSASLAVTESGYSGTFSQTNSCGGTSPIATFSGTSGSGPSWTLSVTGVNAGTCSATFTDASLQQATATITVTSSGFSIDSFGRKGH